MSVINTNVKALVAQESMRSNNLKLSTAMERLSTGLRINSAKDDAAGLAISNRMTAQIRGMSMAIKNANDGISMAQTADGAYGQVTSMLQRMRELAVQAANGAVSGSDRESIQLEIEELKAEITNVAERTNFNGIKLLDGSAQDIKLQTGTNEGELMSVGFSSVKAKDIGSGDNPALTSVGGELETATTGIAALSAGDVVINGVIVGASLATDDALSYEVTADDRASSAIAKVAAINRVSEQSGVYAKVNDTTVLGQTMVDSTTGPGSLTINDVETADITLGSDLEINRQLVTQAINNVSSQTGVRAINTGDDQQGVTLVADDGRNITIESDDFTADEVGLGGLDAVGTGTTYVGTFSLYSNTGGSITVDHRAENTDTRFASGLALGTFDSSKAVVVTYERAFAVEGDVAAFGTTGALTGGTVVINGIAIAAALATDDTASSGVEDGMKAASAIAIAAAINKRTGEHGVTARAEANVLRGEGFTLGTTAGEIYLNGITIENVTPTSRNAVMDRINEVSGQTGVVARAYGEGIELVAEDGRNITIGSDLTDAAELGLEGVTIGSGTTAGTDTVTYFAKVSLSSDTAFTVSQGSEGTNDSNFENLGFRAGTFGGKDTGMKVDEVDVTTQLGAGMAITAIDHAINDVASAQARSGAFQNRLDAAISVLSESSENASAARSRIVDTDYATETTALAKAQIVQQAATAMLAQANQQQQSVLALLQ
jgi:flagellin